MRLSKNKQIEMAKRAHKKAMNINIYTCLTYYVIAVGCDSQGNIVTIKTNSDSDSQRPFNHHAEMHIYHSNRGRAVKTIYLARFTKGGRIAPIHPCDGCKAVLDKANIEVKPMELELLSEVTGLEIVPNKGD